MTKQYHKQQTDVRVRNKSWEWMAIFCPWSESPQSFAINHISEGSEVLEKWEKSPFAENTK